VTEVKVNTIPLSLCEREELIIKEESVQLSMINKKERKNRNVEEYNSKSSTAIKFIQTKTVDE
jgi:hypothetical protein